MPTKSAAIKKSPAATEPKAAKTKPEVPDVSKEAIVAAPAAAQTVAPQADAVEAAPLQTHTADAQAPHTDTTKAAEPAVPAQEQPGTSAEAEPATTEAAGAPAEASAAAPQDEDDEEEDDSPRPTAAQMRPNGGHHMMGRNQAIAPGGRIMPPPRAMAKAEIFEEGDHVVYPTHGVGKVERIATEEIAGHKLELIHITFEENRMTLRVPVAKARTAGLRKLATRKMFDEALAVLRGRARIKRTMWSRRAQEYEAKINSGDPLSIAEVVRDLHRNAGQPDQSFSERQIYEAAMDRLAAELGALDRIDKAAAAAKLADFLKTVA